MWPTWPTRSMRRCTPPADTQADGTTKDRPRPSEPIAPDLVRVQEVFSHLGIEVTGYGVALPLEAVERLGIRSNPGPRSAAIERSRRWLAAQQAALGEDMVRAVSGGFDGHSEIGVDAMCVLDAIATTQAAQVEAVIVVSSDTDLMVVQEYVTDTPILTAGTFNGHARRHLRDEQRGWIDLRAPALRHMAPHAGPHADDVLPPVGLEHLDASVEVAGTGRADGADDTDHGTPGPGRRLSWLDGGQYIPISSDLNAVPDPARQRRREQAVFGAHTVAVTDLFDLSVSTGRAIGVATMPTPATVEELLAVLGLDLPVAQFAAVPDIVDRALQHADPDQLHRQALEQLDDELEALIAAYREDGDVRTQVSVGRLAAERPGAIDPQLRNIEEKKVLTTLAADVLWALQHTDLPVTVLSDRAKLSYLLTKLNSYVPTANQLLVRIRLHGQPITIDTPESGTQASVHATVDQASLDDLTALRERLPATRDEHQIVVLNGPCAAELVGLTRQLHGPALLAAIHRERSDEAVEWRIVRFNATSLGAVLSPVDRPEVEAVFQRLLEVDRDIARHLAAGGTAPTGALQVRLQDNPARPCELPTLRPGQAASEDRHDLVVLVEHRDGSLHLDIDGDQRPDLAIAISHGAEAYTPGHTVIYRRAGKGTPHAVLGPVLPHHTDQQPHVVVANGNGTVTDPDTGDTAALHELPDLSDLARLPGTRLLAYPCADGT